MLWVVGGIVGVVAGVIAWEDYSDYGDHSDYSAYSEYADAVERKRKAREARNREIDSSKRNLEQYVQEQLRNMKDTYNLKNIDIYEWGSSEAEFDSFEDDFGDIDEMVKWNIQDKLEDELKNAIKEDETTVCQIDNLIVRINKIKLT